MEQEIPSIQSREVKGLILGGGRGTRLFPLTAETSKHLLPIGDRPMIIRVVEQLLEANVKDIFVLIDERYSSQFMNVLKDGSHLGIRSLAYIWQPPEGKGLPSAILQMKQFISGGKIVVACGDVLIKNGINVPVREFMKQQSGARLTATYTEDTAGYSRLQTQGTLVTKIFPKDKQKHLPGIIDLGIYMYHPDVFKNIENLTPSDRNETEIWDLNNIYIQNHNLRFSVIDGWWSDAGLNIETYFEAHKAYEKQ